MTKRSLSMPLAILVAAVVLLLAASGGAVAGKLITGKQIKDGSVTGADLKDGSVGKKDLAASALAATGATGPIGPAGPAGAAGAAGATGAKGDQGPRGFSTWDAIPSGVTVTGEIVDDGSTTGSTSTDYLGVDLPGLAGTALTDTTVNFATDVTAVTADDDPSCTGTVTAPTAPPGKVCLYLGGAGSAGGLVGVVVNLPQRAFAIRWVPAAGSGLDMFVYATWAYTAP